MPKPKMFIGSSVEQLDFAYAIQSNLEHDVDATVWDQGVFTLSNTTLSSLFKSLDEMDFGLFVLFPEDLVNIRENAVSAVRDNVIFELGMFIGHLGIERCFLIVPRGLSLMHLPTDLLGITPATFDAHRGNNETRAALGPACHSVRSSVRRLGSLAQRRSQPANEVLYTDETDCIAILQSWLGNRPADENLRVMNYDKIDAELKLSPGAARAHLEKAASHYNYVAVTKGPTVIKFEQKSY